MNLDSSKSYSIPDLYLNIGHLLDHFMMLIFAKAALTLVENLVFRMRKLSFMELLA